MKAIRFALLLVVISFLVGAHGAYGQGDAGDQAKQIDGLMRGYHESGRFNGSVLVAEGEKVIYKKAFGLADREKQIPNEPVTRFLIGSMTKPFTAMLILQLVQEDKIRLDGTISDYLPDYRKDTGGKVTIAQLLTHTSGIPCFTRKTGFWREYSTQRHAIGDVVRECCSGELAFEPGTRRAYSNSGYYILGAILEEVSGKRYEELLKERILDPVGMKDSGYDCEGAFLASCAKGYLNTGQGYEKAPYVDPTVTYAAGGMYSTVEDLYLLDRALAAGRLLSKAQQDAMFTQRQGNYGYGWIVEKLQVGDGPREVTAVSHSGGIHGYNSDMSRMPDDCYFIALLANTRVGARLLHHISLEIAGILYGAPLKRVVAAAEQSRSARQTAREGKAKGALGIGFLLSPPTQGLVSKLTSENDFVDLVLGPGKVSAVQQVKPPVRVLCLARALVRNEERPFPGVAETISLLKESGIKPERVIIGYNPESLPGTPRGELEDLVGSVRRAQEMVKEYGAPLLVAPGLMEMRRREHLYPELAKHCDIWMIQTQQLQWTPPFPSISQRDRATKQVASPEEYRERVKRIADLLREDNPDIKVFVQILSRGKKGGPLLFTAEQVVAYALAIEDLVEAFRIYGGGPAVITEVIERLRPTGKAAGDPAGGEKTDRR